MWRIVILMSLLCSPAWSMECYFTLAKDSCWTNYNVTVAIYDAMQNKLLASVDALKGKPWGRVQFPCEPNQKLMYQAHFSPVFWDEDQGKTYQAKEYWSLPSTINPSDKAWNLAVCYPDAFSLVPFPPDATGSCHCDFRSIPEVSERGQVE